MKNPTFRKNPGEILLGNQSFFFGDHRMMIAEIRTLLDADSLVGCP